MYVSPTVKYQCHLRRLIGAGLNKLLFSNVAWACLLDTLPYRGFYGMPFHCRRNGLAREEDVPFSGC